MKLFLLKHGLGGHASNGSSWIGKPFVYPEASKKSDDDAFFMTGPEASPLR